MANILKGLLYKKVKNSNGEKNTVPFLPKTLAKLVIREDGTSVEDALNGVSGGKSYATFDSKEEYDIAREAGEVKEGTIVIIPRNDLDETEEPVTPPIDENPSDIEEPSDGGDNTDNTEESNGGEETGGTEESTDTPSTGEEESGESEAPVTPSGDVNNENNVENENNL